MIGISSREVIKPKTLHMFMIENTTTWIFLTRKRYNLSHLGNMTHGFQGSI